MLWWFQQYPIRLILNHFLNGFDYLNINRVWLQVLKTNITAIKLYEKSGFKKEGKLEKAKPIIKKGLDTVKKFAPVGVAGAAGHHYHLLIFGLILSIILMAVAANLISGWIKKYKWIAWLGLLAILIVAIELIYTDIKTLIL